MPDRIFDFAVGRTNPATVPVEALQCAARDAIANEYVELTDYHGKLGHPGLRAAMARRESEREGVAVDPDRLSLMNGSMQAVTLVAEALTQPGDAVICEEFTYSGTIAAYRSLGIDMVGLPVDAGRHARRVARSQARRTRRGTQTEVHLRAHHVPEPDGHQHVRRPSPTAHRHRPATRHPGGRGQLLRRRPLRRRQTPCPVCPLGLGPDHLHVLTVEDPRTGVAAGLSLRQGAAVGHDPRATPRRGRQLPRRRRGGGASTKTACGKSPRN